MEAAPLGGTLTKRMRRALATHEDGDTAVPNDLLKRLAFRWAKGQITSPMVQDFALGALREGAAGVERAANLGRLGQNPKMIHRGLVRLFGEPRGAPPFTWINVPMAGREESVPVLLPHVFFGCLFEHRRGLFDDWIRGPANAARCFWEGLADTHIVRDHPHLPQAHRARTIPLGLHGDGGAFTKQDSLFVLSWNSLVGGGEGFSKRFLYALVRKSDLGPDTLDVLWRVFAWSMNALLTGIRPELDWANNPLPDANEYIAGGYRGALVQVRGDWEFYCSVFRFPYWHESTRMCWLCRASNVVGDLLWTNMAADARWRATRWTHRTFCEDLRGSGQPVPVLLAMVIGLTLGCVMIDVLHTVDLGLGAHVVGNIFWRCVTLRVWGGRTQEANVAKLEEELNAWYQAKKEKSQLQGRLTIARLRTSDGWPKLKSKAAAARHVTEFALKLAREHLLPLGDRGRKEYAVVQCLANFYRVIGNAGTFLTPDERTAVTQQGRSLCIMHSQLARECFDAGQKFWKLNPKLHLFLHLVEWLVPELGLNPRQYWTYGDEDVVGQLVEIAQACHVRTLASTALFKWLLMTLGY